MTDHLLNPEPFNTAESGSLAGHIIYSLWDLWAQSLGQASVYSASAETGGICTESDNNWQVCCTVVINSHWMKRFTSRLIS